MSLHTGDFPQADKLEQVGEVAIAIAKGNSAAVDIEGFIDLERVGKDAIIGSQQTFTV